MAYTTIDDPELYFQVKIYTGDGNDNRAITFDGEEDMQPDLTWFKNRGATAWHNVYDAVRGVNKALAANDDNAEESRSDTMDSFDSNGFTLGNDTSQNPDGLNTNADGHTYVAWCWKESATAGFDIVAYTGNATAGNTVSHSLSAVPKMIVTKGRAGTNNWSIYHEARGNGKALLFNLDYAEQDYTSFWNDTTPSSSVFTLGDGSDTNPSATMIAYLWSEKQGFSKFGSYVGNNNADGAFVFTGFRPAFVLIKNATDAADWTINDIARDPGNVNNLRLFINDPKVESSGSNSMDMLSNGFKLRSTDSGNNGPQTYIYAAFAEAPLVNSKGVPCNAR